MVPGALNFQDSYPEFTGSPLSSAKVYPFSFIPEIDALT
jgi:hypothetical protein